MQTRLAGYRDKFIQLNDRVTTIRKEVMAYSSKIEGDIEKDAANIMMLSESNTQLRQHIDSIYACHAEVDWRKVAELMPQADQFFGILQ